MEKLICTVLLVFMITPLTEAMVLVEACRGARDCPTGECCKVLRYFRGKRSAELGSCEPLGTAESSCFVDPLTDGDGLMVNKCPCDRGYMCQGSGQREPPYGESGRCVEGERRCDSPSDCPADECCVNLNRPRGKRSVRGVCRKLAKSGDGCLVTYGSGKPKDVLFMCPCVAGMVCQPNGIRDFPLGELGACVYSES